MRNHNTAKFPEKNFKCTYGERAAKNAGRAALVTILLTIAMVERSRVFLKSVSNVRTTSGPILRYHWTLAGAEYGIKRGPGHDHNDILGGIWGF